MEFSELETAGQIGSIMRKAKKTLTSAESCTGGIVGSILTSVPGSSEWFRGGVIAYSDSMKTDILGVPSSIIRMNGAVSRETAVAMARGVGELIGSDFSISVTGIAGPDGGTALKPVGMVWMSVCSGRRVFAEMKCFTGNRDVVRRQAAHYLLAMLYDMVKEECE